MIPEFEEVKHQLIGAMSEVGAVLSAMWDDDRYVREEFEIV